MAASRANALPALAAAVASLALATGCSSRVDRARTAIQGQIDKNLKARAERDSATFWSIFTPDYRYRAYDGQVVSREEAARGFMQSLNDEVDVRPDTKITIDSLSVRGDTAIVYTRQHYARSERAADSSVQELVTNVTHRERWVHTAQGWRVQYLEEIDEGPFLLDGQPVRVDSRGRRFLRAYWDRGIGGLEKAYWTSRTANPEQIPFEEGTLNDLGYRLLTMGQVDDAIAVLRLNTDAYPKSPNAFNSLGEAYRLKGDKTLAVRAYRHSLELNPENPTAIQALEELGHL
ncbi:MAG TPA: DUF4440 domain-containing protein [Candidatus Eisenbacteria bacterium]|jgi:tetratricopeptide (TPR) repeat protein|nr:DUF4440 domain-containing protein [Candidatus Eisenbacteria bacterium]